VSSARASTTHVKWKTVAYPPCIVLLPQLGQRLVVHLWRLVPSSLGEAPAFKLPCIHDVNFFTGDDTWISDCNRARRPRGGMMDGLTRVTQKPEKPSRLQLAILEWQRQLVLKRASRVADETQ
jgi:hypothetical protein